MGNLHTESFVDPSAAIGKGVILEKDVYISKGAIIYGKAKIKSGTYVGENCIIGCPTTRSCKHLVSEKKAQTEIEGPLLTIGKDCIIRAGTKIYSDVIIGDNCQTGHNAMIREKTTIGNNTIIGTNSVIDGNVTIGNNTSIQTGVYIPLHCTIGNFVFMGPYSKLTNDKYMYRKKCDLIGPTLEDYVSLGANSIIMPGVILKKHTMVGGGAVVVKDTEEKDIVIGNPAKFIKKIPDDWDNQLK